MRWLHLRFDDKLSALFAFTLLCISICYLGSAHAADQTNLQLEVFVNGRPTDRVGAFVLFNNGEIGALPSELEEFGLHTGLRRSSNELVMLRDIPSLDYRYDERTQTLKVTIAAAQMLGRNYDLRPDRVGSQPLAQAGWGAVLNYDLLGAAGNLANLRPYSFTGASLTLNGRAFSPYGMVEQSAIVRGSPNADNAFLRLDTFYRYSDQDRMITYRAGDAINGGLAWTRPIRIGGLQAQSNFALRPDLVTMPLPTLGGTAAVPSTIDVYVNNTRTFSQDIGAGPFSLNNIPVVTGAGNAQLVIRDSAGQETKTSLPFYASASLLAPELTSWSVDAGLPRLSYSTAGDSYVQVPVASATLRRGIFDWLTVEGHAEGGSGVANGGAGAVIKTGNFGVASTAISASTVAGNTGFQMYGSYETRQFGISINVSSQRTFGNYQDLASATARLQSLPALPTWGLPGILSYVAYPVTPGSLFGYNANTPRALDRITIGAPFAFDPKASWSFSFVHLQDFARNTSNVLTATYSRTLPFQSSMFATAFGDVAGRKNAGFVVGLNFPLSGSVTATSSVSEGQGRTTATLDVMRPLGPEAGSYGWRVRNAEGGVPYREASAVYRSGYGTVQGSVSQDDSGPRGALKLRGSITSMGGGVFFSDWIDDGFAVIDAGASNVVVSSENQPIGTTDAKGLLLLPTLRSYQKNRISIDPSNLPVDVEISKTRDIVAPADRSGVLVKFDIRKEADTALVIFQRPDGNFVPAGAVGRLATGEEFIVGYDGQAFIKNLHRLNKAKIEFVDGACSANFEFVQRPGEQVRIAPVLCQ